MASTPHATRKTPLLLQLLDWAAGLVRRYGFDGLRLDAAAEMPRTFLRALSEAAGAFTLGEVWFSGLTRRFKVLHHLDVARLVPACA
jgi:hypothetical protein